MLLGGLQASAISTKTHDRVSQASINCNQYLLFLPKSKKAFCSGDNFMLKAPLRDRRLEMDEVMVTGAGGALGRVVVKHLHNAGLRVHAVYRRGERANPRVDSYRCNLHYEDEVHMLFQRLLRTKSMAIVNCAGGFAWNKTADYTGEDYEYVLAANFRSAYLLLHLALPLLRKHKMGGRMIFISSAASLSPNANNIGMGVYNASKSALNALIMSTCAEVRGEGININAICPAIIDTPRNRKEMPEANRSQWVSCEKIAKLIHLLLSKDGELFHNCFIPM